MTRPIGIMQGRLLPPEDNRIQCFPRGRWPDEFPLAVEAGLQSLEWIYDAHGAAGNPLGTFGGVRLVRAISRDFGVAVRSVCADYFMDFPLLRVDAAQRSERLEKLRWFIGQCRACGVTRVVLPFVDASRIENESEQQEVVDALHEVLPIAERSGVELHLETSLAPVPFAALLERLPAALVKVNYDSGNSASLGYDPAEEFAAYGQRIGSVHIKDRKRSGGTVPLGSGDTDFDAVFTGLERLGYAGDLILQVARGTPGDEVNWAKQNRAFVERYLSRSR